MSNRFRQAVVDVWKERDWFYRFMYKSFTLAVLLLSAILLAMRPSERAAHAAAMKMVAYMAHEVPPYQALFVSAIQDGRPSVMAENLQRIRQGMQGHFDGLATEPSIWPGYNDILMRLDRLPRLKDVSDVAYGTELASIVQEVPRLSAPVKMYYRPLDEANGLQLNFGMVLLLLVVSLIVLGVMTAFGALEVGALLHRRRALTPA